MSTQADYDAAAVALHIAQAHYRHAVAGLQRAAADVAAYHAAMRRYADCVAELKAAHARSAP